MTDARARRGDRRAHTGWAAGRRRLRARVASTVIVATALAAAPAAAVADTEGTRSRSFGGGNIPLELVRPASVGTGEAYHAVRAGESLSAVAAAYGLDEDDGWRRLFDANLQIADPDLLEPGDRIRVPASDEELEPRELPRAFVAPARRVAGVAATSPSGASGGVWDRLAGCESGGNWHLDTGSGYYGGLQFSLRSWQAVGGSGHPHEHSRETQIALAERLRAAQGWGAWPGCSRKLGLR